MASELEPPIFRAVVTPLEAGLLSHAFPTPQAPHFQPVRLTPCAWETGFLSFLRPVVQPGLSAVPAAGFQTVVCVENAG